MYAIFDSHDVLVQVSLDKDSLLSMLEFFPEGYYAAEVNKKSYTMVLHKLTGNYLVSEVIDQGYFYLYLSPWDGTGVFEKCGIYYSKDITLLEAMLDTE